LCGLLVKVDLSECFSLYTVNLPLRGGVHTSPAFSNKLHPCSVLKKGDNEVQGGLRHPQQGWFKNDLYSVIDFDNGTTILFSQSLV